MSVVAAVVVAVVAVVAAAVVAAAVVAALARILNCLTQLSFVLVGPPGPSQCDFKI